MTVDNSVTLICNKNFEKHLKRDAWEISEAVILTMRTNIDPGNLPPEFSVPPEYKIEFEWRLHVAKIAMDAGTLGCTKPHGKQIVKREIFVPWATENYPSVDQSFAECLPIKIDTDTAGYIESPPERKKRLQQWMDDETVSSGKRGALARVAKRENITHQTLSAILK